jgi:hypothetical protein
MQIVTRAGDEPSGLQLGQFYQELTASTGNSGL